MNFFKKLYGLTENKNNEALNYKEEIIEEPISEEPKEEKENSNKIENITDNTLYSFC